MFSQLKKLLDISRQLVIMYIFFHKWKVIWGLVNGDRISFLYELRKLIRATFQKHFFTHQAAAEAHQPMFRMSAMVG